MRFCFDTSWKALLLMTTLVINSRSLTAQSGIDTVQTLQEVMVTASRITSTVLQSGRATFVQVMDSTDAPRQLISAAGLLDHVPGVFNLNTYNFAQDLRLSIRGFGSRSAFGVRGVKVLVDGVPITTPDGQSQFDHIDPHTISRVEVLSGPASSLHGNAAGAAISLQSAPIRSRSTQLSLSAGQYGLLRTAVQADRRFAKSAIQLALTRFALNGYRDHAGVTNYIAQLRSEHTLSSSSTLRATLNYTNSPRGEDPGGVTIDDATEQPRSARLRNAQFDAGEELQQGIASMVFEHTANNVRLEAKGFGVLRDFSNRLPFEAGGQVDLNRLFYGSTWQISALHGSSVSWSAGLDLERQRDHRKRYENLEGVRGSKTLDQVEFFNTLGLFGLVETDLASRWQLQAALRTDHVQTKVDDRFLQNDDQGGKDSYWHLSPSLAFNYRYQSGHHLFFNYGHSFESPTLSALSANPSGAGGFNTELDPVIADQYEIGAKGQVEAWRYQASFFHISLRNDLLPFELADFPGRTFFRNAGKSARTGVEISSNHAIADKGKLAVSYAFSKFTFLNGEYNGNYTPGIPQHRLTTSLDWSFSGAASVGLDAKYQGEMYADNLNNVAIEPITLIDLRAQYLIDKGSINWTLTGGVRNLTSTKYFDNIRINAFGGRFYEPGPRINGYLALQLEF